MLVGQVIKYSIRGTHTSMITLNYNGGSPKQP